MTRLRISANLGFLWNDLPLDVAISKAAAFGFDAVECHRPYTYSTSVVREALQRTGLSMLCLNTIPGDPAAGELGLAALPGREFDARAAIDQAIDYAVAIGCRAVHVMAGRASGNHAAQVFRNNLLHASEKASEGGIIILIEPLNPRDAPGYFLNSLELASEILGSIGKNNIRLMFDCYHQQIIRGDLLRSFERYLPLIGHVQFASVPDRAEPDHGEVNFYWLLREMQSLGYEGFFGAEYKPKDATGPNMGWLKSLQIDSTKGS